jgi:hypothetical protein
MGTPNTWALSQVSRLISQVEVIDYETFSPVLIHFLYEDVSRSCNHQDPNLYYNIVGDECMILVLYVDDLFLTSSESLIVECKHAGF